MKPKKTFCILLVLVTSLLFSKNALSQDAVDYSNYGIAKDYIKHNSFILGYKNLLIFKYTNLTRLNKPENVNALSRINKQIEDVEDYLSQNYSWYDIKKSRGWSDVKLDSTLKNQSKNIILNDFTN